MVCWFRQESCPLALLGGRHSRTRDSEKINTENGYEKASLEMGVLSQFVSLFARGRILQRHRGAGSEWFKSRLFYSLPWAFEVQVSDLLKRSFGDGIDRDRYFGVPYAHVLAIERGEVIGLVKLFRRLVVFGGETVVLGGFGRLTTDRKKRRRGVATALLENGMLDFRVQGCDVAFLCADVGNQALLRLYGRVGFVRLGKPYTYTGESGRKYVERDGMVAPVNSVDKFERVISGKEILDIGAGAW